MNNWCLDDDDDGEDDGDEAKCNEQSDDVGQCEDGTDEDGVVMKKKTFTVKMTNMAVDLKIMSSLMMMTVKM